MSKKFEKLSSLMKTKNKPANPGLYNKLKSQVKQTQEWPSAYASMNLSKKYKAAGGKFKK